MTGQLLLLGVLSGAAVAAFAQHDHGDRKAAAAATEPPAAQRTMGRPWTRYPLLLSGMARGERAGAVLRPVGIDAAEVQVSAAGGPADRLRVSYPVGPEGAKIQAAAPKIGNYHWVVAREEREGEVRVASTAWYFSNPGPAPTDLLAQPKHELEIVPAPLPREHSGYREAEKWRFLVRLNGVALAGQPLLLETEFGSRSTFLTDDQGVATVLFPRDFRPAADRRGDGAEEAMGPRRAKFVLATEKEHEGRRYLTAFNYAYSPDPDRNRSLAWGAAFGLLGMAAATPLLRRRASGQNDQGAPHA